MMRMPIRIILFVRPLFESQIKPYLGEETRKFFLNLIDDNLISRIRGLEKAPYAIKPLHPASKCKIIINGKWLISPRDRLTMEFDIIDPGIEERVLAIFKHILNELNVVNIAGLDLVLERAIYKLISYEDFFNSFYKNTYVIRFLTPTIIGRRIYPVKEPYYRLFPSPVDIYEGLLHLWNKYCPESFKVHEDKFLKWLQQNVYARAYRLKTSEITIKNIRIAGFKGFVKYVIKNYDNEQFIALLLALTKFGEISNIGVKRTYGCGVISLSVCKHCDK